MGTFKITASYIMTHKRTMVETATSVYNLEFDTKGKLNKGQIVGTACNELYRWVDIVKTMGSTFRTTGGHFDLQIISNSTTLDTSIVHRELKQKLSFNKTPESRKKFAQRVFKLVDFMSTEPTVIHIDDLSEILS